MKNHKNPSPHSKDKIPIPIGKSYQTEKKNRSNSATPKIEDRLLSYKKNHKNWVAQERFKKQSRAMGEMRNTQTAPQRPESGHHEKQRSAQNYNKNIKNTANTEVVI